MLKTRLCCQQCSVFTSLYYYTVASVDNDGTVQQYHYNCTSVVLVFSSVEEVREQTLVEVLLGSCWCSDEANKKGKKLGHTNRHFFDYQIFPPWGMDLGRKQPNA